MGHLIVSFLAALAMAISTYDVTGSILWTLAAYSVTGTLTLVIAILADFFGDQFNTTE